MKKLSVLLLILLLVSVLIVPSFDHVAYADDSSIKVAFATGKEQEAMRLIADSFTAQTGITVELIERLHTMDAKDYVINYAETTDAPDIIFMQGSDVGELSLSNYLMPIEVTDDISSRYVPTSIDAFTVNGVTYGIGYSVEAGGLIYNKDLISQEELPTTWDEFFEIASQLTIRDTNGTITQYGTIINPTDVWNNYPIIEHFGGYYFGTNPDGTYNAYDVGFASQGMKDYCQYLLDRKDDGIVQSRVYNGVSVIVSAFCDNNIAMIVNGFKQNSFFDNANINYGIAPLPKQYNGSASLPIATVNGFVINNFSTNKDASMLFLNYILQDNNQQLLIEAANGASPTGTRPPANISVLNSDYVTSNINFNAICQLGFTCRPWPNIPESTIWYNYTHTALAPIFYNDADIDTKLNELQSAVEKDIINMNKTAERVDIPWYGWLILGACVVALIVVYILKLRANKIALINRQKYSARTTVLAWGLMVPLIVLLGVFYVFPIVHNIYLSMTDYSGIKLRDFAYVGVYNYQQIFQEGLSGLASMLLWTCFFAFSVVAISFIFGTFLATLLDKVRAKIAKVYRMIFIFPWVIPSVIILLMWSGMLSQDGMVNNVLSFLGLSPVGWLTNPIMAKVSSIFVMIWFSFPYYMVVAFGFIQAIPKDYYESARVDGASTLKQFTSITLPLVFKAILPTLIMGFIMQFNQFGIYMLTGGGPHSVVGQPGATDLLITYVFNMAFNSKRYGFAAAYSTIIFVFIAIFSLVAMKVGKRLTKDDER